MDTKTSPDGESRAGGLSSTKEQDHYHQLVDKLVDFCEEHDGKHVSTWECDFIDSVHAERGRMSGYHITERQRSTIDNIFDKLTQRGLL